MSIRQKPYGPATPENIAEATVDIRPDERIREAVIAWNHVWPEQLESGVMFYKGLRITRAEFEAV